MHDMAKPLLGLAGLGGVMVKVSCKKNSKFLNTAAAIVAKAVLL